MNTNLLTLKKISKNINDMYSFNNTILNLIFYQKVLARLMSDGKSVVSSE